MLGKRLRLSICVLALAAITVSALLGGPGRAQERLREPEPHPDLPASRLPPDPPQPGDGMRVLQRQPELLQRALAGLKVGKTG